MQQSFRQLSTPPLTSYGFIWKTFEKNSRQTADASSVLYHAVDIVSPNTPSYCTSAALGITSRTTTLFELLLSSGSDPNEVHEELFLRHGAVFKNCEDGSRTAEKAFHTLCVEVTSRRGNAISLPLTRRGLDGLKEFVKIAQRRRSLDSNEPLERIENDSIEEDNIDEDSLEKGSLDEASLKANGLEGGITQGFIHCLPLR
ncbi:hypothetical protein QBC35DRAFT_478075 [Podospora australis]|uniref:Uncharacterized protein n=1 Tax=Podospora australis TaxID=1536484 RepID=A0AAN7ADT5_9PEZI|nr:hypothetical protein QBC35DRAFT_478075 [Podospora australis]